MDKFNRMAVRKLRDEMEVELNALYKKYGIVVKFGNARFSDFECSMKLELKIENKESQEKNCDKEKALFEIYAPIFGFYPEDFGKRFAIQNQVYTITGINPNRPKFPISGMRLDGKQFKFSASTVKRALLPVPV